MGAFFTNQGPALFLTGNLNNQNNRDSAIFKPGD